MLNDDGAVPAYDPEHYDIFGHDRWFTLLMLAAITVLIYGVLMSDYVPPPSAEPRGAPVNAPVFADSASPVLQSVSGPDVSSGN